MPPPISGIRPAVRGKFLHIGDAKLHLRGVTYGTFRPGQDGTDYPDAATVDRDFEMMCGAGFNAVRTYTPPPEWLLDRAAAYGLRLLIGLPWEQHIAFLGNGRGSAIERRVREAVRSCAGHAAVLGYSVGNEIPAAIVRWSGKTRVESHIRRLYDAAKREDPEALVTYVNYPSTEYLELPFLDFLAFNVYLESRHRLEAYLARLQNIATDRPLVMAELGLDSQRNGRREQAFAVQSQVRTAFAAGCAGAFVFSWTDEWHRGGHDVDDWTFGLTTKDRRPKPALSAVSCAMKEAPFAEIAWPRISVVVCVYNAADTIAQCLGGLRKLDYPDFELIVVDDGSTDETAEIAARFDVRLIRQPNRGLSDARNSGLDAASGEIVAYIDGDAWPDPHWLRYLATTFTDPRYVGVGGPNLAPAGDGMVAACVSASPGGPIHVLVSDREAEHIPGCNMAFRRLSLLEIGGFDVRFRTAGDDVDICWRLLERGGQLGFSPAAVVWHHQRSSVAAFWKQQRGYGQAEALLEVKWPQKYNVAGHVTWGGRVYGAPASRPLWFPQRVYHGTWGLAPFQPLEQDEPGAINSMVATPEWYLLVALLLVLSALGLAWKPLLVAVPLLAAAIATKCFTAVRSSAQVRYPDPPAGALAAVARPLLTTFLHLIQPAARLYGRLRMGLSPWRLRSGARFRWPRSREVEFWCEGWRSGADWLTSVETNLRDRNTIVLRGTAFDPWDIEVRGGYAGLVRIGACAEEHGGGRQLIRFRLLTRSSATGLYLVSLFTSLGVWAVADAAWPAAAILGAAATMIAGRAVQECGVATGAALAAIKHVAHRYGLVRISDDRARPDPASECAATETRGDSRLDGPTPQPLAGQTVSPS